MLVDGDDDPRGIQPELLGGGVENPLVGLVRNHPIDFLGVMAGMGLIESWWALLAFPAALLIGFAFSAVCMALTTWMKSWQDFDKITLAQLPMFLFSATFFPLTVFPTWLQWVVEATPLYRGVVLCRELTTGSITWASGVSVVLSMLPLAR